jgi:hypothetical protein
MTPYPKPEARCLRAAAIKAEEQKAQRAAYAAVTRRDGKRCRFCARPGGEHHHIEPRSRGGRTVTHNLVLLCGGDGRCHQLAQQHVLRLSGNPDEMGKLEFADSRTGGSVWR